MGIGTEVPGAMFRVGASSGANGFGTGTNYRKRNLRMSTNRTQLSLILAAYLLSSGLSTTNLAKPFPEPNRRKRDQCPSWRQLLLHRCAWPLRSSSGLLAANLPLLSGGFHLPVAFGVDLFLPTREHILRRDEAGGAVQPDVDGSGPPSLRPDSEHLPATAAFRAEYTHFSAICASARFLRSIAEPCRLARV